MNKIFALAAILACTVMLNACNTMEGAGEDVQAGGHAIKHAAQDAKN